MRLASYIRSPLCDSCKWDKIEISNWNPVCVSCRQMTIVRVDNYEEDVPDTNDGKMEGKDE